MCSSDPLDCMKPSAGCLYKTALYQTDYLDHSNLRCRLCHEHWLCKRPVPASDDDAQVQTASIEYLRYHRPLVCVSWQIVAPIVFDELTQGSCSQAASGSTTECALV